MFLKKLKKVALATFMLSVFVTGYNALAAEITPPSTLNTAAIQTFSASTEDRGLMLGNMSITDYINTFGRQARLFPPNGFSLISTHPTTTFPASNNNIVATISSTVSVFRHDTDHNIWLLHMNGTARGSTRNRPTAFGTTVREGTAIAQFGWDITQTGGAHLMSWSPSGTITSTQNNFPVNVSITGTWRGISGSLGSTFNLFQTDETVSGAMTWNSGYSLNWSTNRPTNRGYAHIIPLHGAVYLLFYHKAKSEFAHIIPLHGAVYYNTQGRSINWNWTYPLWYWTWASF